MGCASSQDDDLAAMYYADDSGDGSHTSARGSDDAPRAISPDLLAQYGQLELHTRRNRSDDGNPVSEPGSVQSAISRTSRTLKARANGMTEDPDQFKDAIVRSVPDIKPGLMDYVRRWRQQVQEAHQDVYDPLEPLPDHIRFIRRIDRVHRKASGGDMKSESSSRWDVTSSSQVSNESAFARARAAGKAMRASYEHVSATDPLSRSSGQRQTRATTSDWAEGSFDSNHSASNNVAVHGPTPGSTTPRNGALETIFTTPPVPTAPDSSSGNFSGDQAPGCLHRSRGAGSPSAAASPVASARASPRALPPRSPHNAISGQPGILDRRRRQAPQHATAAGSPTHAAACDSRLPVLPPPVMKSDTLTTTTSSSPPPLDQSAHHQHSHSHPVPGLVDIVADDDTPSPAAARPE